MASFDLVDANGLELGTTLLTASFVASRCPLDDGSCTVDMILGEEAMVSVGKCYNDGASVLDTTTGQACHPLSCENSLAVVDAVGASCEITIEECDGSAASTLMSYRNFDVTVRLYLFGLMM